MSKALRFSATLAIVAGSLLPLGAEQRPVRRDLLVAAAASLSGLAPQLTRAFHDAQGIDVRFNFASSNTLARQIVEGARVNVFISADAAQMDLVEQAGRLVDGSRVNLLGNQLKIIVTTAGRHRLPALSRPQDLLGPNVRRIALGDPAAVPVGVYAREWLQDLGLWNDVATKVVPLPSSPAVLAAVREGRAEVGIVYVTDDRQSGGGYLVPISETPRIVYPAAVVIGARQTEAQLFVRFLQTAPAQRIFRDAGFIPLS
jgi:molybdate transport system substrate-binding protein